MLASFNGHTETVTQLLSPHLTHKPDVNIVDKVISPVDIACVLLIPYLVCKTDFFSLKFVWFFCHSNENKVSFLLCYFFYDGWNSVLRCHESLVQASICCFLEMCQLWSFLGDVALRLLEKYNLDIFNPYKLLWRKN